MGVLNIADQVGWGKKALRFCGAVYLLEESRSCAQHIVSYSARMRLGFSSVAGACIYTDIGAVILQLRVFNDAHHSRLQLLSRPCSGSWPAL